MWLQDYATVTELNTRSTAESIQALYSARAQKQCFRCIASVTTHQRHHFAESKSHMRGDKYGLCSSTSTSTK